MSGWKAFFVSIGISLGISTAILLSMVGIRVVVGLSYDPALGIIAGVLTVFFTSIWLAIDSSRIRICEYETDLAMHPLALFTFALLLGFVVFPVYLVKRSKILAGALEKHKGESQHDVGFYLSAGLWTAVLLAGGIFLSHNQPNANAASVPTRAGPGQATTSGKTIPGAGTEPSAPTTMASGPPESTRASSGQATTNGKTIPGAGTDPSTPTTLASRPPEFDRYVSLVRDGVMEGYNTTTIGKAFEATLSNPRWKSGGTAKGERVVTFTGMLPAKLYKEKYEAKLKRAEDYKKRYSSYEAIPKEDKPPFLTEKLYNEIITPEDEQTYAGVTFQWTFNIDGESFKLTYIDKTPWINATVDAGGDFFYQLTFSPHKVLEFIYH
jgi:hypothetical protein